ncbi:hypothetical protein RJ639_043955 [Escallonia herrerae]|uniref:Pentatricopeptide repeat-containing protein n=1 Tax=Escallonia herrerae TaxID=1293975 RepID=A0AA88WBL5_9ASTE|nr:hypothetical protein RJ639_043955 [Escallonia herrerae]
MLVPNIVTGNLILTVHVQSGCGKEWIGVFKYMRRAGIYPDRAFLVTLLQGYADMGVRQPVDLLQGYMLHAGLVENVSVATGSLTVYAKSGRYRFFIKAMELFELMVSNSQEPNHVTFTHLLGVCSRSFRACRRGKEIL